MKSYLVRLEVAVIVTVNDLSVIERITGPGGDDWRAGLYDLHTEEEVVGHLAYNCAANGVRSVRGLDGWADCAEDAAMMEIESVETAETTRRDRASLPQP